MKLTDWQMDTLARVLYPKMRDRLSWAPPKPHFWSRKPKPPVIDRELLLAVIQTTIIDTVIVIDDPTMLERWVAEARAGKWETTIGWRETA